MENRDKCALCGKSKAKVNRLIVGLYGGVCQECIELCTDILREGKTKFSVPVESPHRRLWAPWRFPYLEKAGPQEGGCIFVDLPAQNKDRENLILFRAKTAFVIMNAFPYTNGHLMVAPFHSTNDLAELSNGEMLEIQSLIRDCARWLTIAYKPEGFNIGANLGKAAGAGIEEHLHWHIVPRWVGDTNFMPVIGDVRVLPQSLEESYDRIRAVIDAEQGKQSSNI